MLIQVYKCEQHRVEALSFCFTCNTFAISYQEAIKPSVPRSACSKNYVLVPIGECHVGLLLKKNSVQIMYSYGNFYGFPG